MHVALIVFHHFYFFTPLGRHISVPQGQSGGNQKDKKKEENKENKNVNESLDDMVI